MSQLLETEFDKFLGDMGAFFAQELTELNDQLESDDHGYVSPSASKKSKEKDKDADDDS